MKFRGHIPPKPMPVPNIEKEPACAVVFDGSEWAPEIPQRSPLPAGWKWGDDCGNTAISPDGRRWKRIGESEDSKAFRAYWESMVTGSATPEPTLESVKARILESGDEQRFVEAPQKDRAS